MTKVLDDSVQPRHHATYILEFGVWRATCRVCDWTISHPQRRHAAAMFRAHINQTRVVDVDPDTLEVLPGPDSAGGVVDPVEGVAIELRSGFSSDGHLEEAGTSNASTSMMK